ncbi:MAG TPA: alanyl-tRNA synthetase [Chitinophagales bacterium]|nr:alanyl-tRNA synthetase [Chitinophagales bacterium]
MENNNGKRDWRMWLKRLGVVGFLFFLIKGLGWIAFALFAGKALFD